MLDEITIPSKASENLSNNLIDDEFSDDEKNLEDEEPLPLSNGTLAALQIEMEDWGTYRIESKGAKSNRFFQIEKDKAYTIEIPTEINELPDGSLSYIFKSPCGGGTVQIIFHNTKSFYEC